MKTTLAIFAAVAFIEGGFLVHGAKFDVKQFRANAGSIVREMAGYFEMFKPLILDKLSDLPFANQAENIIEPFFETLPDYKAICHLGRAEPNYSVQKFFTDLTENLPEITAFYEQLKRNQDQTLQTEKLCLSEHVIHFVVENKDTTKIVLTMMKAFGRLRDEL